MSALETTLAWEQNRFVTRARALFYSRMMFLSLGLLILAVPAWSSHFGLRGVFAFAGYFAMLLYSVANFLVIEHRVWGRILTYVTLCLDLIITIFLITKPQVGAGLRSPLLGTQLMFTTLFAILFPTPLAILPPLLTLPVVTRVDQILRRSDATLDLLTLLWYAALDFIIVGVIVYLNEREAASAREVMALQSSLKDLAVVEERNRLAREIHDGLGASLSSLIIQSEYLLSLASEDKLRREITELRGSAEEAMEELRRSLQMMRDDFELSEGLAEYVNTFRDRTQLNARFTTQGPPRKLPPDEQLTLFRVLQECLSNAAKHAEAKTLDVQLAFLPDAVALSVRDDGRGFDAKGTPSGHYGLIHMQERATKASGHLIVDSTPNQGTQVTLTLPTRGAGANT
ncbi:MAG: sensor histidine kinase [Myxococcaceae bacterium]